MAVSTDSRIWLATHLLYPNSSQAFDVYQTLVTQSESSIKRNNINSIFQKLYHIVEKIPAISSNKAFHVFDEEKTEQWRQIYKKSQKDQLIIFIGYFIFNLKLKEISGIIKLTLDKTQFLFHQTFKKAVFSNIKTNVAEIIPLRKYNEEKVSFLFTNENLIDFCLNNLSPPEMKNVKLGLQLYPELQTAQKQFDLIVGQMHYLIDSQADRLTKTLIQTSETLSEPNESFQLSQLFLQNKKIVFAATSTFVVVLFIILRPNWIQSLNISNKDRYVDLQEIRPQQVASEQIVEVEVTQPIAEISKDSSVAEVATAPVGVKSPNLMATSMMPSVAVAPTKIIVPSQPQPLPQPKSLAVKKHEEAAAAVEAIKLGGLYRGVLIVTDLNEVSSKITEKLVDIGGKKAGEVELGWRKSAKLSYYHFMLPENNVDTMKEFLTKFGDLQIQFENHPRLMPAGVKRLIIEVKERE